MLHYSFHLPWLACIGAVALLIVLVMFFTRSDSGADEEQEAAHGRATDLWFDELPPLSVEVFLNTFQQRLRLNVRDDQQALMLEHRRREVSVWLGFELTGEMQKTSKGWDAYSAAIWGGTWVSLKAESPVVFLVDTSGEVLLHRRYE